MTARSQAEDGMTLVEVIVAAFLLIVGLLVILSAFDVSDRQTANAGRLDAASQVAEQELQRIDSLEYAQVALNSSTVPAQTSTTEKTNPTAYLKGCATSTTCTEYDWNWASEESKFISKLVMLPGGTDTTANPRTVTVAAPKSGAIVTLSVYRFITWVPLTGEPEAYKRVTIVVKNAGSGYPKTPRIYTTLITNQAGASANPLTQAGTTCAGETSCTH
jgi:Tfp pilus assembly protein PilV